MPGASAPGASQSQAAARHGAPAAIACRRRSKGVRAQRGSAGRTRCARAVRLAGDRTRPERQFSQLVLHRFALPWALDVAAHDVASITVAWRSLAIPSRSRPLAVPSGIPSASAISAPVRPYTAASTTARRWSSGRSASAARMGTSASVLRRRLRAGARCSLAQENTVTGICWGGAPGPQRVDGQVARDGERPAGHGPAPRVVHHRMSKDPDEGLLGDVLGAAGIAKDRQRQPEQALLVAPDKDDTSPVITYGNAASSASSEVPLPSRPQNLLITSGTAQSPKEIRSLGEPVAAVFAGGTC